MEKRILKWTTGCFGLLTIVMCTTLCLLPGLKDDVTAAVPTMPNSNTNISQETPIEIDQEELVQENKLNIELPEGLKEKDVRIFNDYLNSTVYVRFAKAVDNYSEKYMIHGSSDHIANLSYYKEGTEGVLEINNQRPYVLYVKDW